jgi:ADP-heptose:LPS heptosyltransferase
MAVLPARLLVDLPNWLGDFVHTLPALAALTGANRSGRTTVLLPNAHAPLARLLGVDMIARPTGAGLVWARRHLAGRFDVALTARHSSRAKLLIAGTGAKTRLASRGRGSEALGLATFRVVRTLHQRHDLDGALALLGVRGAAGGSYRLQLPERLKHQGLCQRALLADLPEMVALLPATRGLESKRYPMRHFVTTAKTLVEEGIAPVVFVGPGEETIAARLASQARALVAPTSWPLHEVAALLAACDAAVGNDSGLTHLAAAVGCPTVALFGPTDPARTAPVGSAVVLSAPDSSRTSGCLDEIDPLDVVAAIRGMVSAPSAAPVASKRASAFGVAPHAAQRYDWAQRVGR